MKKTIKLFGILFLFGAILMSCEGPAGADGLDGTNGVDGVDGADGADGVAGTLACMECHSDAVWDGIVTEFALTKHNAGTSWARGTSASCAMCHSNEGYISFVETGSAMTGNGTSLKCGTCHTNHGSLEGDIAAPVREVGEVVAIVDATGATIFDHGTGNLCATCHQSRTDGSAYDKYTTAQTFTREFTGDDIAHYTTAAFGPNGGATLNATSDTLTVVFDVPVGNVYVSSTHAGPHHGPQANTFAGITGYPTAGVVFDRDHHTDCAGCHLTDETGNGHTFSPDIAMCDACHGTAVDIEVMMADFSTRVDAAVVELVDLHLLGLADATQTSGFTVDDVHPMYSSSTREHFQAFYNIMCILEDKSFGVHNPTYTEQMMTIVETNLGL